MGSVKVKLVDVGDSVSVRKGRRLETTRLAETRDMSRVIKTTVATNLQLMVLLAFHNC